MADNTQQERVGVYVCHCGSNIAGVVDVQSVARFAAEDLKGRGVVVARDYTFMCSVTGQELIEQDIREQGLTRVVVAACSPHLHEGTFRGACGRAGLNPYLAEMASIREHVAWVHTDKAVATAKAKAIVNGAVERVLRNEPLEAIRVPIEAGTLVVGGGIAGLQTALEIAEAGYPVHLVEREPSIGGHMAQFDKTFPTLDCAACILTPKMAAAGSHPHIQLHTWSEVEKVEGYVGNYTVTVKKKPRYVLEDVCTGCGICIEKCPVLVVDEAHDAGIGYRKAIYTPFAQAVPNIPVLDPDTCTYYVGGKGGCRACEKFCPTEPNSIVFDQQEERITLRVGNIVLATGWDLFDARRIHQYGYGRLANVFTNLELERMCNAAGPTGGKVVLRDGQTAPARVGIVHCVGSRDRNYNNWCSSICCMQSVKLAHLVKERTGAEVFNFYIDMRTPAKDYDEFYQRVLDEGVHFIRGKVAEVSDVPRGPDEQGPLFVQVEDTLAGLQRRIPVDMVVLSAGLEPRRDSKAVGKTFGIACSTNGWFIEKHAKLDPIATMTEGVFVAGCAQGPKDIPASVAQGAAAAARVLSYIRQGELALEPVRASVNEAQCSGCRLCNGLCPFNAISFIEERRVTEINAALCQGCGTCVAACPAGAISGSGFSNEQLLAQIEGLLLDVARVPEPA
ncbi:MAG TPA: CoB--CoM heterodisulfide reductase iron-sulfur subunit A family protein [Thiobacillaceae bacterium]|nr:CoB--CoM heterodisulfide reductase iron-sulfur subunit A family protein [Thiobacillaceae bacterium]